jgi:hypothetical protein
MLGIGQVYIPRDLRHDIALSVKNSPAGTPTHGPVTPPPEMQHDMLDSIRDSIEMTALAQSIEEKEGGWTRPIYGMAKKAVEVAKKVVDGEGHEQNARMQTHQGVEDAITKARSSKRRYDSTMAPTRDSEADDDVDHEVKSAMKQIINQLAQDETKFKTRMNYSYVAGRLIQGTILIVGALGMVVGTMENWNVISGAIVSCSTAIYNFFSFSLLTSKYQTKYEGIKKLRTSLMVQMLKNPTTRKNPINLLESAAEQRLKLLEGT